MTGEAGTRTNFNSSLVALVVAAVLAQGPLGDAAARALRPHFLSRAGGHRPLSRGRWRRGWRCSPIVVLGVRILHGTCRKGIPLSLAFCARVKGEDTRMLAVHRRRGLAKLPRRRRPGLGDAIAQRLYGGDSAHR